MSKALRVNRDMRDKTGLLFGVLILVVVAQAWLIFEKAINWDEFLHFGQIYDLAGGKLSSSVQTIHTRLFGWAALVSQDVVAQIQAARFAMLACVVLTATGVVILARRLADFQMALLCGLAYLTAGFVFTNAFTYRPDPVAAAALIGALCIFAYGQFSWRRAALVGVLIGLAGAVTIKSIFYLPCFAAIAWLHWSRQEEGQLRLFFLFCATAVISVSCFALLVGLHGAALPAGDNQASNLGRSMDSFIQFAVFEKIRYVLAQAIFAPLVTISLIALPFVARRLPRQTIYMLLGLCGPLLCLLFYRNTFPYFFTFLLPPICVAIAPVLSRLVERYGHIPVLILSLFGPVFLLVQEPFGTLERQRATISEIERLFPAPTPYLSYSSYVPHYPRQFPSLISGVALHGYWSQGDSRIARDIEAGRIAFVIATGDALDAVYQKQSNVSLLPDRDVQALRSNFLQHSDTIYIAGREICPMATEQVVTLVRNGPYSLEGGDLVINGRPVAEGATIRLDAGTHRIGYPQGPCVKLWALDQIPKLPKGFPAGPIAGGF